MYFGDDIDFKLRGNKKLMVQFVLNHFENVSKFNVDKSFNS